MSNNLDQRSIDNDTRLKTQWAAGAVHDVAQSGAPTRPSSSGRRMTKVIHRLQNLGLVWAILGTLALSWLAIFTLIQYWIDSNG